MTHILRKGEKGKNIMKNDHSEPRTASEAGWRLSRYNISAKHPENKGFIIVKVRTTTSSGGLISPL